MSGRTTWWAKDAAWHRRERLVELGEEFGAEGPHVMDVLSCWAQEQNAGGAIRGGFRILARESFVTVSHAQSIVERAGVIGALDDLEVDGDGRRFQCRVSGWKADADRGRAAVRQGNKRNRDSEPPEQTVTDRDEFRSDPLSALPHHREGEREEARASPYQPVLDVLAQCPRLHVDVVGVENAIASWPERDPVRAARSVVTWATDPTFRSTNAARLLVDALSKQTPEKLAAVSEKDATTARRLAAIQSLGGAV